MKKQDFINAERKESESFKCMFSMLDGFVYRPSNEEEAEEIRDSLREVRK